MGGDLMLGEARRGRTSMEHAVIGSLITSTLLTRFVMSVVYTLLTTWCCACAAAGTNHARVVPAPPRAGEPEPKLAD